MLLSVGENEDVKGVLSRHYSEAVVWPVTDLSVIDTTYIKLFNKM